MTRFTVIPNGCGGWAIWDNRDKRALSEISHRSNAVIAAGRLNSDFAEWGPFYGAKP